MGSKSGYKLAVLAAMGLRSGIGADAVLLNDAGPWGHVWGVLADPARCRRVAEIIRGWKDEDPRALWERLREEHRGTWDGWTGTDESEHAAGWILQSRWTMGDGRLCQAPGASDTIFPAAGIPTIAHRLESVAAWLQLSASNRLISADWNEAGEWRNTGKGGTTHGGAEFATPAGKVASDTEGVAAWLSVAAGAYEYGNVRTGMCKERWIGKPGGFGNSGGDIKPVREWLPGRVESIPPGLAVYPGSAMDLDPGDGLPDGCYTYIDPPYQGTTGYSAKLARKDVLALAQRWADAGALVCVSEAEPLPLEGWTHIEITSTRVGQKRTFSKQQREWLTVSRDVGWRPAVQREMFG